MLLSQHFIDLLADLSSDIERANLGIITGWIHSI